MFILLADLDDSTNCKNAISTLQNYLVNCNSWGYYEVTLFNNTLSYYSNELIDIVYSKSISILHSSPNQHRYQNEHIFLLFNILEIKILSKNIESAKFYLFELQKQKDSNKDNMYFQTVIKYFSAIIGIINKEESEDTIIKIINIFDFLELEREKELYNNLFHKVRLLYL